MTHQMTEPKKAETISRDEFFSRVRASTTKKTIVIPGLGSVEIRGLTAPEAQRIKSGATPIPGGKSSEDTFAILTVVEGLVAPKLTTQDIASLREDGKFGFIHRISSEIWKLSGVDEEVKNG